MMNQMKRIGIISVTLIILLINFIFVIPNAVNADVEDGWFSNDEWMYNLQIKKVTRTVMLDIEGRLWYKNIYGGLTHKYIEFRFSDVSEGRAHYLALDQEGYLWAWGDNSHGQLGNGTTEDAGSPIAIYATKKFSKVFAVDYISYAIDTNGNVYAWGSNEYNTVLNSTETKYMEYYGNIDIQTLPYKIESLSGTKIVKIDASYRAAIALDDEGYIYGWGINSYGQIGDGAIEQPTKLYENMKFKDISMGNMHSIFLTKEGKAYTAGAQYKGGLGNGNYSTSLDDYRSTLEIPLGFEDVVVTDVQAIDGSSAFLDEDGNVWTCGKNEYGQLGNNTTTDSATVVKVAKDNSVKFTEFATNSIINSSYLVFDSNNNLWGWGRSRGALENYLGFDRSDDNDNVEKPTQITDFKSQYTVTFMNGTETVSTQIVAAGQAATEPSISKPGYILSWDEDFSNVTSDLTVRAIWTAKTDTPYRVEHYFRTTDREVESYALLEVENLGGTTDSIAVAVAKNEPGFTENTTHPDRVAMGTVTVDGSLVLKLYYDRNTYKVTLDPNGGTINSGNVTEYVYGMGVTLPTDLTKTGYSFIHWWNEEDGIVSQIPTTAIGDKEYIAVWYIIDYLVVFKDGDTECSRGTYHYGDSAVAPELTKAGYTLSWDKDFSYITSPLTVNAVWTPNTNTSYKVEHYLRNLDTEVEGYDLKETENLTGTTDTQVTALAKTYEGFTENTTHSDRLITGTIAGDGSLVLKLYYDRNSYNINYELNGGTATGTLTSTYLYGKELILSNKVEKQGYIFAGWYSNSTLTGNKITTIGETETGNKTFYAKWIKEDEYYITSVKYEIGEEYITKVSPYTSVSTFLSNINTNGTVKVLNANQQEVIGDAFVGTGYILQVEFDGTTYEYEIVVRGDIDGNGKITVTDLSMLNQTIVRRITLIGAREKAADIDYSGKISITDLSMLNQTIVGRITL